MVRFVLPSIFLAFAAPAIADEVTGTVLAFDRVDKIIILEDKTVWNVKSPETMPEDLKAGDSVRITFKSEGDSGTTAVNSVVKTD